MSTRSQIRSALVRSSSYNPFALAQGAFVITDKASNPEAASRLADLLLSEEAALRSTIGRPGVERDVPSAGELGVNGKPATRAHNVKFGDLQTYIGLKSDLRFGQMIYDSAW